MQVIWQVGTQMPVHKDGMMTSHNGSGSSLLRCSLQFVCIWIDPMLRLPFTRRWTLAMH